MRHLGSREAGCTPYEAGDGDFIARLAEVVADADDRHLATYVTGGPVPDGRLLRGELAKLSKGAQAHPVYFGSELTGAGVEAATAADIAKLWGLAKVRIGDSIGTADCGSDQTYFAPPTLETVVVPADRRQKEALFTALTQLAEQDPLINLRQDDFRRELSVSLYGEVQKEVIQATPGERLRGRGHVPGDDNGLHRAGGWDR